MRGAFVDDEHDAVIGRLVAFQNADLDVVVTAAMVEIDDFASGFLHGIRIDRAADLKLGFFGELLGADAVVAEVFDVANDGAFDDLEDHDAAARRLLVGGLHIDKPTAGSEFADVVLNECRIERPADAGLQLIENLRCGNRAVAHDADVGDRFIGGRQRGAGNFARLFFLAEHRGGRGGEISHAAAGLGECARRRTR